MKLKPNPEAAREFLEVLDAGANSFCFQTFDDLKSRRNGHLAHTIHSQAHRIFATLERLNNAGAGIFVCVNEIRRAGVACSKIWPKCGRFSKMTTKHGKGAFPCSLR